MEVYKAINAVQAELAQEGGISKDRKNVQQGYNFRGIDDVYNALAPLLSKHGLCILPRIIARECIERTTAKGSIMFSVTVEAEFDFVCSRDGSKHVVRTYGEAMDSGDKATNKAMSAAYKYAAFQAFAIPTEGENDADTRTPLKITPLDGVWTLQPPEMQEKLLQVAAIVQENLDMDDARGAYEYIERQGLDTDAKAALWTRLDSKTRSALKRAHKEAQGG